MSIKPTSLQSIELRSPVLQCSYSRHVYVYTCALSYSVCGSCEGGPGNIKTVIFNQNFVISVFVLSVIYKFVQFVWESRRDHK